MKCMSRAACFVLGIGCFSLIAQAGVVIQQEGGGIGAKQKQKVTVYIDSGKMRVEGETPEQKKFAMIFDGDKQVVWIIDPGEGTYREMTATHMEQMGQQMGQMMKQMEAQMANMPPQQRKMMEEMMKQHMGGMGGSAAPTVTVEEKGSGEKVGSFTTMRYAVMRDGRLTEEVWAASLDQVRLKDADYRVFQQMAKFYEPLRRDAPKGSWTASAMEQIKGFPVKTLIYEGQKPAYEWNVLSIEDRSLDGSLFSVPATMKKAEPMNMGGMGR